MSIISEMNQRVAKQSLPPYDKQMSPKGPYIVSDTPGKVVIFDGWQNLPPQNLDAKTALDQAFVRCMCIQRAQIKNRIMFYSKGLQAKLPISHIIDPFKMREEAERKAFLKARKSLEDLSTDDDQIDA